MTGSQDTRDDRLNRPYEFGALAYMEAGIGWPIPSCRPLSKQPPLKGWTGKAGGIPTLEQVEEWRVTYPDSSILLRLRPDVVGIDVDAYGDKRGGVAVAAAEEIHGPLPATWRSSARGDDNTMAGIRFYRLTDDMDQAKMKGDLGPGSDVEVIRFNHRFAVVYPSLNPSARARYQWYTPNDYRATGDDTLTFEALPFLPSSWYSHLTHECECFAEARRRRREQSKRYRNRPSGRAGFVAAADDFLAGLEELADMPEGSRNNYLSKLAGRTYLHDVLISEALKYEVVTDALVEAASKCGLDDTETERTIKSAEE